MSIGSFILWMILAAAGWVFLQRINRRFPVFTRIVGTIVIGSTAGLMARFFIPGAVHLSFGMTALLGIAGAAGGEFIGNRLSGSHDRRLGCTGIIMAVIGSVILLWAGFNFAS